MGKYTKKKIIIAYENRYTYSSLIKALSTVTDATLLFMDKGTSYSSVDEVFYEELKKIISDIKNEFIS